jgi:AraC-like DNA-binding protein
MAGQAEHKHASMHLWRDASLGRSGVDLLTADRTSHRYGRHFHEEHAIAVFEAGAQRNRIGRSEEAVATPGTLVLIPPGEPHTAEPGMPDGFWSHRAFYPDVETVLTAANAVFSGPDLHHVEFAGGPEIHDPTLAARIARCHKRVQNSARDRLRRQQAFAEVLEALLLRFGSSGRTPRQSQSERAAISRAVTRMKEKLDDPELDIDELAGAAGLSRFYFMRSFRATTGMSAHSYLVQLRLVAAQEKLAAGDAAARVAIDCGFFDQSHLIRHFRSAFGVTPGQYARSSRS